MTELRMIYSGFTGNKAGSDVLLSFNLLEQGLKRITDAYDVKTKRKSLAARRANAKSLARRMHNACVCGVADPPRLHSESD